MMFRFSPEKLTESMAATTVPTNPTAYPGGNSNEVKLRTAFVANKKARNLDPERDSETERVKYKSRAMSIHDLLIDQSETRHFENNLADDNDNSAVRSGSTHQSLPPSSPTPTPTPMPLSATATHFQARQLQQQQRPAPLFRPPVSTANHHLNGYDTSRIHEIANSPLSENLATPPKKQKNQQPCSDLQPQVSPQPLSRGQSTHFHYHFMDKTSSSQLEQRQRRSRKSTAFRPYVVETSKLRTELPSYQQEEHTTNISSGGPISSKTSRTVHHLPTQSCQPIPTPVSSSTPQHLLVRDSLPYNDSLKEASAQTANNTKQLAANKISKKPSTKRIEQRKNNALQAYISYMTYTDIMRRKKQQPPVKQHHRDRVESSNLNSRNSVDHSNTIVERPLTDFLRKSWRK